MHLLAAQAGALQQEGEAIDLGQSPGEIVFASAADSELVMLAGAADRAGYDGLRLANSLRLSHNMSVDLWLEQTVRHARLVVVRLLGGASYWQYGVDELTGLALNGAREGLRVAFLPGDATPDPVLRDRSTVAPDDWTRLHALFTAGGPQNADALLDGFQRLAKAAPGTPRAADDGGALSDLQPQPFARFGYWQPDTGVTDSLPARPGPEGGPNVPLLFYRAALEGAGTATLEALVAALQQRGLTPVPLLVSTLKEAACVRFVQAAFERHPPAAILNLTGFALGLDGLADKLNPFAATDAPVIQLIQASRPRAQWETDAQGLSAKDLAMQVVLPELDGRHGMILVGHKQDAAWHERTQCPLTSYVPDPEGVGRAVTLAENWARLRMTPRAERRVGIVLANYPIRDGRLANGVGYDAPQSTVEILNALLKAGYGTADLPTDGNALIALLQAGPTNAAPERGDGIRFSITRYLEVFATLPRKVQDEVTARWGAPEADPFCRGDAFHLPAIRFGTVTVLLQPARGYHLDASASYHDPDLVPPHGYLAAYLWLRHEFSAHAVIHNGKHGNLEWLPGKATALDRTSYPAALWAELPQLYPFIVNDPGEGTQAKRRTGAVIIDHLVPPLTRAQTYGPLKDLEALLDEYYAASGMDRRRLAGLRTRILDFARDAKLDRDIGLGGDDTENLTRIDTFLCELKEAQIRDGLHVFGQSPTGRLERDLAIALARVPRGAAPGEASLIRALADDLRLGIDPLTADLGTAWDGPEVGGHTVALEVGQDGATGPSPLVGEGARMTDEGDGDPAAGAYVSGTLGSPSSGAARHLLPQGEKDVPTASYGTPPRTVGQVVERLEGFAAALLDGLAEPPGPASAAVLETIATVIRPRLAASGPAEMAALLDGLDGRLVAPGPSGAPSRGRLDVLPTGRNFYSVDNRAVPTPMAWELGQKSAETLLTRHFQEHGSPLAALALSVWGTANMRTGGDDIAQALAFIGARPVWDPGSLRITGYEIVPLAKLGRPRVDVTLRISGFFRDAFPAQIALFDRAIRAIGALDEPAEMNPIAARMRAEALGLMRDGASEAEAALKAGHRVFGSKPGAYGAGLQGLMDDGHWSGKADLAEAFLNWGQYAYGAHAAGLPERERFAARLGAVEAVVHNQDNREHDLLDSDDYYQFEGGLTVTAEVLKGAKPLVWHNDHSRPERPLARTLEEEISRVMRSRVVNPKWIDGVKRHGYKGAFEIIATVDYMFAFAATTGAVKTHHFDLAFAAFVEDEATAEFIQTNNRYGWDELLAKFDAARRRGFWTPQSNSAHAVLDTRNAKEGADG